MIRRGWRDVGGLTPFSSAMSIATRSFSTGSGESALEGVLRSGERAARGGEEELRAGRVRNRRRRRVLRDALRGPALRRSITGTLDGAPVTIASGSGFAGTFS